jgi:uncharacterized protein involved in exopolysaccharide biosynthesis
MEEIYFRDVVSLVWRSRWWTVATMTIAVSIAAALYAIAKPRYEVSLTLVPATLSSNPWQQQFQGASSLASQFLGVPLGDDRAQKTQQFLSLFRSPVVLERVGKQLELLPHFFPEQWDADRKQWIPPNGWTTRIRTMLRTDLPWVPPSLADAQKYLERRMTLDSKGAGTLVAIEFVDPDPAFGIALLQALYRESDEVLRSRARAQNDEHIRYIQKSLSNVSYAETRQSLTALLTFELGQQIMINSNSPYAMEVLKPAFADPRPVSPNLTLYTAVALVVGFVAGVGGSVMAAGLRPRRRSVAARAAAKSVTGNEKRVLQKA